jgi:hypothetical protein
MGEQSVGHMPPRTYRRARDLTAGQPFVLMTQGRFTFTVLALTVSKTLSITRSNGVAVRIPVEHNSYGIREILFDWSAEVILASVQKQERP